MRHEGPRQRGSTVELEMKVLLYCHDPTLQYTAGPWWPEKHGLLVTDSLPVTEEPHLEGISELTQVHGCQRWLPWGASEH